MNSGKPSPRVPPVNGHAPEPADPWPEEADEGAIEVSSDIGRFAMMPEWLLQLSPLAVKTYLALALHAGRRSRECWPSQALLAEEVGVSDRSVRTALSELEQAGAINRKRRARKDPATGQIAKVSTLYRVRFRRAPSPDRKQASARPNRKQASGATGSRLPTNQNQGTRDTPNGVPAIAGPGSAAPWPRHPESGEEVSQVRLVELFQETYQEAFGESYEPSKADYGLAAKLLRTHPLQEIGARSERLFELATGGSDYWRRRCSVKTLWTDWRELGVAPAPEPAWKRARQGGAR